MSILDNLRTTMQRWLMPAEYLSDYLGREAWERAMLFRNYRQGRQREQLRTKPLQANDNVLLNYTGLIIERSVSLLVGEGITFDFPGETETVQEALIKRTWAVNSGDILLHELADYAGTHGTGYVKIIPDGLEDPERPGVYLPRLVVVDPLWVTIETETEDNAAVLRYVIRFNTTAPDGGEMARREVIERIMPETDTQGTLYQADAVTGWTISNYWSWRGTGGRWALMTDPVVWPYPFPPMVHFKNLPNPGSCYGLADITEPLIELQDRVNFVASNIAKIIRYHAHPRTWGKNFGTLSNASWGADEMIVLSGDGQIANLEMQSDLSSSLAFYQVLRQSLFDTARTVDLSSMADKVGQLTNFALRVLYQDTLAKLNTKRELYGEALVEINRRILLLGGYAGEQAHGGAVVWPETLVQDTTEQSQLIKTDLELGLVSKQTAAGLRGYDWEQEQARMGLEQTAEDNLGAALLRAFDRGG